MKENKIKKGCREMILSACFICGSIASKLAICNGCKK